MTKNAKTTKTQSTSKSPAKNEKAKDLMTELNDKIKEQVIDLNLIDFSPTNPRRRISDEEIKELAGSIKEKGLIQAILVRPAKKNRFEIVFGERRCRASRVAGFSGIRAGVADLSDEEVLDMQIHENLHRQDIHPLDEATSYEFYLKNVQIGGKTLTEEELAHRVGKDVRYVRMRLKLNLLIDEAKADLSDNYLPIGLALELAKYSEDVQTRAYGSCFQTAWQDDERVQVKSKPVNVRDLRETIQEKVLLNLKHAPFSLSSETLNPVKGACVNCPTRTGADNLLFPEMADEDDFCMVGECYQTKLVAHVEIQRREIAQEKAIEKVEKQYEAKIEKAEKDCEEAADKQVAGAKFHRLKAELKEVKKFGADSDFALIDKKAIEKQADKVVLMSADYYSNQEGIIASQDYKEIKNSKERCAFYEKGVFADGKRVGQKQEICRNKKCEKHHASSSYSNSGNKKSGDELKARYFELYNIRTNELTRQKVFAAGAEKFGDESSIWTNEVFQDLILSVLIEYSSNHSSDHRIELVGELLEIDTKSIVKGSWAWQTDEEVFAINDKIKKLDSKLKQKFLFLLTIASFGENKGESSKISQESVKFLADNLEINLPLLDAEARVETCETKPSYKKFKSVAENYLKDVKNGKKKKLVPPNYWAD